MISLSGHQGGRGSRFVERPSPLLSHQLAAVATLLDMMASQEIPLSRREVAAAAKRLRKMACAIPVDPAPERRA